MHLKKSVFSLYLFIFVFSFQVFAYSGMLAGEKSLKVTKTKWFDIIYPECCAASASILYEKADTVYEEVTEQYGLTPAFRMPVVISPAVDRFNAFWTAVPYNHIAIYDTGISGESELAVFSETLLSTFRHELTHAVTYNMKNGFWRVLGKIFGDCVAPGMLSVTTGMAEGATVTSESAAGEGRLNDEYAKHYVKQAKIEDKFPSYHDVSGAADNQPGGAPYFFNGAFHGWLQEKYGLEAYAQFWYRVVNGKNFTISGAFKKSFGVKLKEAWKQFVEDYEVPDVVANPVEAGIVQDFFEPDGTDYSRMNDAGSQYDSLTSAAGRIVWVDQYGSRVFAATANSSLASRDSGAQSYRHIFSQQGLSNVRLSNDGRFLTVNYFSELAPGSTAKVKIYDFENGSFYKIKEGGLKDAVVLSGDGGLYLIAQKYLNQQYSIVVFRLLMDAEGRRITGNEKIAEKPFAAETDPYAFTALDNGTFAYLKKQGLSYSLCISAINGTLIKEIAFPEGMSVRSLSYSNGLFFFSYAQKGTLPRLGTMELSSLAISLSSEDISGGVFEPVEWDGKVVYIARFLRQARIFYLKDADGGGELGEQTIGQLREQISDNLEEPQLSQQSSELQTSLPSSLPAKSYNPFPYLVRGTLIPASDYVTDPFSSVPIKANSSKLDAYLNNFYLGATFLTANPWTEGSSDLYKLTAGWNTVTDTLGTSLTVIKGTATSLLKSQTEVKSEFNADGWKQGGIVSELSSGIPLGRVSTIAFTNTATALINRKKAYSLSDVVVVQFSTVKKAGPGRFEKSGFVVAASYGKWYEAMLADSSKNEPAKIYDDVSSLAASARVYIPHLLPFESKYGFTYNLPVVATFKLLPTSSVYGYVNFAPEDSDEKKSQKSVGHVIFDGTIETTIFSMDIQKAIPGITALYLNDFYVSGGYAVTGTAGSATKNGFQTSKLPEYFSALADGTGYYLDSVYAKAGLEFTPNIGVFAKSSFKMGIYGIYSYTIHSDKKLKPQERLKLSLGLDMNF